MRFLRQISGNLPVEREKRKEPPFAFPAFLYQRRKQPQNALPNPQNCPASGAVSLSDLGTLGEQHVKIPRHVANRVTAVEQNVVLEMVIQAPVVKVRAAYGGDLPVAQALLCMAEARRILENPHALPGKAGIIGAGDGKYHFFCPEFPA